MIADNKNTWGLALIANVLNIFSLFLVFAFFVNESGSIPVLARLFFWLLLILLALDIAVLSMTIFGRTDRTTRSGFVRIFCIVAFALALYASGSIVNAITFGLLFLGPNQVFLSAYILPNLLMLVFVFTVFSLRVNRFIYVPSRILIPGLLLMYIANILLPLLSSRQMLGAAAKNALYAVTLYGVPLALTALGCILSKNAEKNDGSDSENISYLRPFVILLISSFLLAFGTAGLDTLVSLNSNGNQGLGEYARGLSRKNAIEAVKTALILLSVVGYAFGIIATMGVSGKRKKAWIKGCEK